MDVLYLLKSIAKIFASKKIMKKQMFCEYAGVFFCMLKRPGVHEKLTEEMILLCSPCLWSDPRSLNGSHSVCTEDLTNTIHIRSTVMCCAIFCVCAVVSACAATLKAEICAFRSLHVTDMPILLLTLYRTSSHRDWIAHVAMDPGVTLEKHMLFLSLLLETINILLFRLYSTLFHASSTALI